MHTIENIQIDVRKSNEEINKKLRAVDRQMEAWGPHEWLSVSENKTIQGNNDKYEIILFHIK